MAKRAAKKTSKVSFEQALEKLEQAVSALESGELGLSESLTRYEEGVGYLKQCHEALEDAEQRIRLVTSVEDDGRTRTVPFDEEDGSLEEKQGSRSRRRSAPRAEDENPGLDDMDTQRGLF